MVTVGPYRALRLLERCGGTSIYVGEGQEREVLLYIQEHGQLDRGIFLAGLEALRNLPADLPAARVVDGGVGDTGAWVASERLLGRTWAEAWEQRRRRSESAPVLLSYLVWCAVMDLLDVLEAAHARGVVHGGLSPHGLLTSPEDGRTMIAHFGLPWLLRCPLGLAPRYRAPEHFDESPVLDVRTDVFGAGLLLYQLLSGITPHHGVDAAGLRECVLSAALPRSSAIPLPVAEIIERATAKRPAERYPTVAALREALRQAVVSDPAEERLSSGTRAVQQRRTADEAEPPASPGPVTLRSADQRRGDAPAAPPLREPDPAPEPRAPPPVPPQAQDQEAEPPVLAPLAAPPPAPALQRRRLMRGSTRAALPIASVVTATIGLLLGAVALVRRDSRPAVAVHTMPTIRLVEVPRSSPEPVQSTAPAVQPPAPVLSPPRSAPMRPTSQAPEAVSSAVPTEVSSAAPTAAPPVPSPTTPLSSTAPSGFPKKFPWEISDPCALSWYRCTREVGVGPGP